jgi:hypothetical protein
MVILYTKPVKLRKYTGPAHFLGLTFIQFLIIRSTQRYGLPLQSTHTVYKFSATLSVGLEWVVRATGFVGEINGSLNAACYIAVEWVDIACSGHSQR